MDGETPLRAINMILPYPISSNRYWRAYVPKGHTRSIVVLSAEAKAYKAHVKGLALAAGIIKPIPGRVELAVWLYPARPRDWAKRTQKNPAGWDDDVRSIDLDNALKVTIDAIKEVVIEDDSWIRRIVAERMAPDDNHSRLIVTVRSIAARS